MTITENELLEELIAALPPMLDPKTMVTAKMIADRSGMTEAAALEWLKRQAKDGKELRQITARREDGYTVAAFVRA